MFLLASVYTVAINLVSPYTRSFAPETTGARSLVLAYTVRRSWVSVYTRSLALEGTVYTVTWSWVSTYTVNLGDPVW